MKMKMALSLVCPLLLLFLSALPCYISLLHSPSYYSDQQALLSFKHSLSLHPNNSLSDWSPHHYLCNWTGVACSSRHQRVVSLNLTGMSLAGPISPFLGNLSFLRVLALRNNSFHGQIPSQLGNLFRLRVLRLSKNKLEGSIPSTLANCYSLQRLILSYNLLSGIIPSQLGLLSHLQILVLGVNKLTGIIPPSLGNLSSLVDLKLGENKLHGDIPIALSNCTLLQNLSLDSNTLTGVIPNKLGMLTQLRELYLSHNNLTGVIPIALSKCTLLQIVSLASNKLTGHIPNELGMLNQLRVLYLNDNNLTGVIPDSISNCTLIRVLQLNHNQLTGRIPSELGKLFQLEKLLLWGNHLVSGSRGLSFLTALSNCSSLKYLQLSENYLTGTLPSSISHLSSRLFSWTLDSNKIEGNIPNGIGNLTNLVILDLSNNHFSGSIPLALSHHPNLQKLFLDKNNLNGRIPESFGHAKRLGLLSLSENMISGEIPKSLGDLPQLRDLVLHHNQLSGRLPASLGRCITLEKVDLAHNKLEGNIPLEWAALENLQFYFDISNNLLQGSISVMSKMVMVQAIDVSVNNFSGNIPDVLSSCTNLLYLNLSCNSFDGLIPTSLTSLKNLQVIDLSSNNLSGTIPMAFQEMKMLQYINLSSNNLIGEVPKRGVFARIDKSAVSGNVGLCGDWIKLQPCFDSKHKQFLFSKKVIILVVISIAIFIMSSAVFLFFYRRNTNQNIPNLNFGPERISYEELVDATSGFSQTNLLGVGSFGSVYRGILKNGTNTAVKVLNLQDENAIRSFETECNVLKRVRHRNVIKIISACSNLDFRALVLPFMSNGSLERWLYPQGGHECRLNLADRLRIAKEIAQGMEYLHHYCFVQVIHCDLKPSNVLLGNDMTPHIADFGITKLLFENSMNSLTSTTALKGSIGYFAPEYGLGGSVSTKGDVYSYGILLLELLTRRRPTDTMFVEGLVCTRELPQQRPNMMEIVERLEKITSAFLGTPRDFHLPINILPLLESTNEPRNCNSRSPKNWSTSTS
ncbi:hypothetical protein SUGI_1215690 [Cryptomeria japonica]|uniref:non-specific serine/threonine protein kinase n=2 Tax=Cryptomeria japonica TaxID=3369 RepID=A0AAD3RP83_CRYJA|nr:hypothetical protein SUGI_1215630 [Cryptomeria japonica]GLJ56309.1 hypothetical protein SUGI_1215690 [Cryptomeria japonica]